MKPDSALTETFTPARQGDGGSTNGATRQAAELLALLRPPAPLPGQFSEHLPALTIFDPTKQQETPGADEPRKETHPRETPVEKGGAAGFEQDLQKRHDLFAKDANAMRQQLIDANAIEKVQELSDRGKGYSIEFQGADGKNLRLTNVLGTDVFVVKSDDKVYLLNDKHPELDTVLNRNEPANQQLPKVDWSANPALATEMKSMITDSLLALNQEARTDHTSARAAAESAKKGIDQLDTSVHILNFANKEGLLAPKDYAQRLNFAGLLAAYNLNSKSEGLGLMKQATAVLEREAGPQDETTLASYLKLSKLSSEMKNPQEANLNLQKAVASLEKIDRSPDALSMPVSIDRDRLVIQLEELKTPSALSQADAIQKRAYDMVLNAPESEILSVPSGLSIARDSLIHEYTFKDPSKLMPLLDQSVKSLQAPNAMFDANESSQLALRYLEIGSAEKAESVLDTAVKSIEADEQKNGSTSMKRFRDRLTLDSYLDKLEGTEWLHQTRLNNAKALDRLEQSGTSKQDGLQLRDELIGRIDHKNENQLMQELVQKQIDALESMGNPALSAEQRRGYESTLGELNVEAGDYKRAAKHYEASAKLSSHPSEVLNTLAKVYDKLGRNDEAEMKRKEAEDLEAKAPKGVPSLLEELMKSQR